MPLAVGDCSRSLEVVWVERVPTTETATGI